MLEAEETKAVIGHDGGRFELELAASSEPGLAPDVCRVSLAAPCRLPAEYVGENLEMCEPDVSPKLATDAYDDGYLRVLVVQAALPVDLITAGSLRWLFLALVWSRDSLLFLFARAHGSTFLAGVGLALLAQCCRAQEATDVAAQRRADKGALESLQGDWAPWQLETPEAKLSVNYGILSIRGSTAYWSRIPLLVERRGRGSIAVDAKNGTIEIMGDEMVIRGRFHLSGRLNPALHVLFQAPEGDFPMQLPGKRLPKGFAGAAIQFRKTGD
jgi:hypothetical protein